MPPLRGWSWKFDLVVTEEVNDDAEIPGIGSGSAGGPGVLRLRLAIRFAHRQTPLRMTSVREHETAAAGITGASPLRFSLPEAPLLFLCRAG